MLTRAGHEVVQFDGPVLELLTESRIRFDQRLAGLGPDILAEEFQADRFLARLRADDNTRGIGDALLEQRNVAGIGNLWKSEGCFDAGIDPWRPVSALTDAEVLSIIDVLRPRMLESARTGKQGAGRRVFRRHGEACSRCGAKIRARRAGRRQPHYLLVSGMSALKRVGHKGADLIAPGNTPASFDAALAAGVDMIEFDVLPHRDTGELRLAHDYEHFDHRGLADPR